MLLPFSTTTTAIAIDKLNCTFCGPNIQKPLQEIADDHMGVVNCQKLWKIYGQRQVGTPPVTCFLCNKAKTKKYSNAIDLDISHANVDKCYQIIFIKKLTQEQEEIQSLTEIEMEHCDMVSAEQSFSAFEICTDSEKKISATNAIAQPNRQLKVNTENFVKIEENNLETKLVKSPNCTFSLSNIKFEEIQTLPINVTNANVILRPAFRVKNKSTKINQVPSNLNDSFKNVLPRTQGLKEDTKTSSLPSICQTNSSNEILQKTGVESPKCTSSSVAKFQTPPQNTSNDEVTLKNKEIFDINQQTIVFNTSSLQSFNNMEQIEIKSNDKLEGKPNIVSIVPESGAESLEESQSNSHVSHLEKNDVYSEQKEVCSTEPTENLTSNTDALQVNAQLCKFDQTRPLNQVQDGKNKYQLKIIAPELHFPEPTFEGAAISECNKMETNSIQPETPNNSCLVEEMHEKQPSQPLGSSASPKARVSKPGPKKRKIKSETQQQESITGKSNKGSKMTVVETSHQQIEASTECNQNQSNIFDQKNTNAGLQSMPETIPTANQNINKGIIKVKQLTDQSSNEHKSLKEKRKSEMFINTQYGVCGKIVQTCQTCSKEYPSISKLWHHYLRDHNHTAPINCNLCPFTTTVKHQYFTHINTVHCSFVKNIWPSCTRCYKYFDHIVPLKHHYALQHKLKMSKETESEILYQFLDMVQSQSEQHNQPMQQITSPQHNQPLQQNKSAADNPLQNNLSQILLEDQTLKSLQDQFPIQVGLPHQAQSPKQDISSNPGQHSEPKLVKTDNSSNMFENQEQTDYQKEPLKAAQFIKDEYLEANPSLGQSETNHSLIKFQPSERQTGSNSKMLKAPKEKQKIIYLQPTLRQRNPNKKQPNMKKQCNPIRKSRVRVDPNDCLVKQPVQTVVNQNQFSSINSEPTANIKSRGKCQTNAISMAIVNQLDSLKTAKKENDQTLTNKVACEFCSSLLARSLIYKHITAEHINQIKDSWPKCHICSVHFKNHKVLNGHFLRGHQYRVPRQSLKNPHQTSVIPKDMGRSILSLCQTSEDNNLSVQSLPPKTSTRDKSPAQNTNVKISSVLKDISNSPIIQEEGKTLEVVSNQEDKMSSTVSNIPSNHILEKESKFPCKSCAKEFGDDTAYNAHVNEIHKFICRVCHQEFQKLMKLSEHYFQVHAPKNTNDLKQEERNSIEMKDPNQGLKRNHMQPNYESSIKKTKFELVENAKLDSSKIITTNEIYKTNCNMTTQSITQSEMHESQSIHLPDDKESEESNLMKDNFVNKVEILSLVANAKVEPELFLQSSPQYQTSEIKPKSTSEQDSSNLSVQTTHTLNKKETNKSVNGLRQIRKITRSHNAIGQEAAENSSKILNSKKLNIKVEKLTDSDEFKIIHPESQRKLTARKCSFESDHIQKSNDQDSKTNLGQISNSDEKSDEIETLTTANIESKNITISESIREIRARKKSSESDIILKLNGQDSETNLNQISSSTKSSCKLEKLTASEDLKIKSTAKIVLPQSPRQLKARQCSSENDNNQKRPRRKLNLISSITHLELSTTSEDLESKKNVRQSRSSNNAGCPKSKLKFKVESPSNKETDKSNQTLPNKKQKCEKNPDKIIEIKSTEGLFGCKFCPTVLQQAALLEKHTLKNHKDQQIPYLQCTQCDIKFEAVFQNRQHTQIFHSKVQARVLDLSSPKDKKEYTRENNSTNSNRLVNSEKTSIDWKAFVYEPKADTLKCKLCEKEYTKKSSFKRHLQGVHFQEKMYCGICQKTFTSKSNLNRHSQTHLLEPKLECSYCPRLFKNKYGLQYHLEKYHNIKTEITKSSGNPEPQSVDSFIAQPYSPACQEEEEEEESFIEKMIFNNLDDMETEIDPDLSIQVLEDLVNESINSSTADQHISSLLSSLNIPESEVEDSFMESDVENPVSPGSNEHTELREKTIESSNNYSVSVGKPVQYTYDPEQSTLDDILNNSLAIEADLMNISNSSVDSGFNHMVYEQGAKGLSNGESTNVYSKEEEEEELNQSLSSFLQTNINFFDLLNLNNLLPNL